MRAQFSFPAVVALFLAAFILPLSAQEKNGLFVSFNKKTVDRSRPASDGYGSTRVDRVQTVLATIRNTSIREFPEGEVQWTVVVKKSAYYLLKYSGKEVLKSLRPSSSAEVQMGAIPMTDYRGYTTGKDQMEYEIVITHGGKETLRYASDKNFAALAANAYAGDSVVESNRGIIVTEPTPRTSPAATPSPAPTIVIKPNPTTPAPAPVIVAPAAAPKPAEPAVVTEPPKPAGQPFDFFGTNK